MLSAACSEMSRLNTRRALETAQRNEASNRSPHSTEVSLANARVKATTAELSEHRKYCAKCLGRWIEFVGNELLIAS
jgi:hypothetical protein